MSGGVDSSVAALLLREAGYQVIGITMHLWSGNSSEKSCCSLEQAEDARAVAARLGFSHYTLDLRELFYREVISYFEKEYLRGRTPNPCILCNEKLKFDYLLNQGRKFGCKYIATGHYARIERSERPSEERQYILKKGVDPQKDQSYFLCRFTQSQLARTLLPLGTYTKEETRKTASEAGLVTAGKRESQEICFIPDHDYRRYIQEAFPEKIQPGALLDMQGNKVGEHRGFPFFTVGQRRKLGVAFGSPRYVVRIDAEQNRVVIGEKKDLEQDRVPLENVNWTNGEIPDAPLEIKAKLRYQQKEQPARVTPLPGLKAEVIFKEAQTGVSPGQALVFYQDDRVLGGGWIV